MKNKTTHNYFQKIQKYLKLDKSILFKDDFLQVPENQLEALWNLLCAGYPMDFAILNYINLYEYVQVNSFDYNIAIKNLYSVFPGLIAGIYIKKKKWFELN